MKKFFSIIYLITSLFIALGAAGHSFAGIEKVHAELTRLKTDPAVYKLIIAVWHFAGVCMVLLGILAVFAWTRITRGEKSLVIIPLATGLFYIVYGTAAVAYTGAAFFTVFIVLGTLLLVSAMFLRRG